MMDHRKSKVLPTQYLPSLKLDSGSRNWLDKLEAEVASLKQFRDECSKELETFKSSVRQEIGKLHERLDTQVFERSGSIFR